MPACACFVNFSTNMSKRGGPNDAWSSTIRKSRCENQNESILESGISLQKTCKVDEVHFNVYFIKFIDRVFENLSF